MLHIIILCVIPIFLFIYTFSSIHPLYKDIKIFGIAIIFLCFTLNMRDLKEKISIQKKRTISGPLKIISSAAKYRSLYFHRLKQLEAFHPISSDIAAQEAYWLISFPKSY